MYCLFLPFQLGGGGLGLTPLNLNLNFGFLIRRLTNKHGQALDCGRVNFDVLHRQPLQDHPGSGGQCIDQFGFVAEGPVLILATLFSLVEKLAGTSGDIGEGVEGMGCTMSGGQVIVHWKGQWYVQVFLG